MADAPKLSVVVLSWNTVDLTRACLRALQADTPAHSREVIVIDNGSADGSAAAIAAEFPDVILVRNQENVGYAAGNNQGANLATGEFVCTLNSDTEVAPGALDLLVDFLDENPDHAAVSPRLVNPDGTVQTACMRFPGLLTALCFDTCFGRYWPGTIVENRYFMRDFDHVHSRDVDQPPGACFLIRRAEFLAMDGFDTEMFLFFNDVDFCRRLARRGRKIRYLAEARVTHHGGASTRGFEKFVVVWHRNRMAYYRKQYGPLVMPFIRMIVRLRGFEEWLRAGRRQSDPEIRRAERAHLKANLQEILAR